MYNILRTIGLAIYKPFMNENLKTFINKRLNQDFSNLKNDEYIWIHCSSMGEVNLSEDLVRKFYTVCRKNILISVFTDTGYENAVKKYSTHPKIKVIYFPIDDRKKIKEILSRIRLKLLVLIETELWPNIINEVKAKEARVVVVNGRISDRSYPKYKKLKFILKPLLKKIDYFYMQSEIDKERIISLGANENDVENVGNLKFSINLEKFSNEEKENYKKFLNIKDRKIFVAGSTRTGEDEIILEAYKNLKDYILIIVPRHLDRIPKIENMIRESNFSYLKYSELESSEEESDIILVDKMGVLRKLYAISDLAFVGGTLVNIGGHNLLEPLFYRKKLIFGKYTQNVFDIASEILKRKIGFQVESSKDIVETIRKIETENNLDQEINNFFDENKLLALNIVKKENLNMKKENMTEKEINLWKHFFHSEKSNYNIYMYKLLDYPDYIMYDNDVMKRKKGKWSEHFSNSNPIALEIGTGSGNFMRQLAERNQNKNFIGLELRFKRLVMAAEKCRKRNIGNVAFLRKRGEELEDFLTENEISELYINFPDPWEGTEKNRIIQESLFKTLDKIMKKDGVLYFKTDHDVYYNDVLELVKTLENYEVIYHTPDLHNSEKAENNIKTEFEQLFLHKYNKNINYIEIKKIV